MCDAAMREDVGGFCKCGPLCFITPTAELSPFCSVALRCSQTGHTLFCPHEELLSINLHFPLLCPPLRNWFSVLVVLQGPFVHSFGCKVLSHSCNVAIYRFCVQKGLGLVSSYVIRRNLSLANLTAMASTFPKCII